MEWGAGAKCRHMFEKYPDFIILGDSFRPVDRPSPRSLDSADKTENISLQAIDLELIHSAASEISGVKDIEQAIKHLLSTLCRTSDARRAVLFFFEGDDVYLQASIESTGIGEDIFSIRRNTEEYTELPGTIIRYVRNTGNMVNIGEKEDSRFTGNNHIQTKKIQSAFCSELLTFENKSVIMYLENDLLPGLFNAKRMTMLNTIIIQIKALLENILLKDVLDFKNISGVKKDAPSVEDILQNRYLFTTQEIKIAIMLRDGTTREELCDELSITQKTLKNHLYSIYSKTINLDEEYYSSTGRIDKLSKFLLFMINLDKK
jgi:DNA-binding CsgD family transcriptional regulator